MTVSANEGCITKEYTNRTSKWLYVRHNTIFQNDQLMVAVKGFAKHTQDDRHGKVRT
jgi:hypothetical protein